MEKNEYQNLRQDVLECMVIQRDIVCRKTKTEMIKFLLLDDEDKYIRDTLYEKIDGDFYIAIDTRNQNDLISIGKLIEKGEVLQSRLYQNNRIYFKSDKKIEL